VILDSYLATAAVASPLLRSPQLADRWTRPSALAEFAVSGLAGHLTQGVFTVETFLDSPALPDVAPIDAVHYYLLGDSDAPIDDPIKQGIRTLGERRASVGPARLADDYDESRQRLATRLATTDLATPVTLFDRWVLPLDQLLVTRMVELAVHLDDFAVSLDVPMPAIPEEAAELVVGTLARIALGRRGLLPVLRALSRRERASGLATAL